MSPEIIPLTFIGIIGLVMLWRFAKWFYFFLFPKKIEQLLSDPEVSWVYQLEITICTAAGEETFILGLVNDYCADPMTNDRYREFIEWMNNTDNSDKLWSPNSNNISRTYYTRDSITYFTRDIRLVDELDYKICKES